jgi:hypothetical protein
MFFADIWRAVDRGREPAPAEERGDGDWERKMEKGWEEIGKAWRMRGALQSA